MLCIISTRVFAFTNVQKVGRQQMLFRAGVWESMVNGAFVLDIILNFRTAYISHEGTDVLVTSKLKIAISYAQGFLAIDLLSTIPWDIILANGAGSFVQLFKATKVVKLVRIMQVLKLVRILRLLKVRWEVLSFLRFLMHA
jgi:hypothetical protein